MRQRAKLSLNLCALPAKPVLIGLFNCVENCIQMSAPDGDGDGVMFVGEGEDTKRNDCVSTAFRRAHVSRPPGLLQLNRI